MGRILLYKYFNFSLLMVWIIIILASCGVHKTHLTPPDLVDKIPPIKTGFYNVYTVVDGSISNQPGSEFLGNMVYLYKDHYFVKDKFFAGVSGSFLPNYRIITTMVNNKVAFFWQDIEEDDLKGEIFFEKLNSYEAHILVSLKDGGKEKVVLKYQSEQLWEEEVPTIWIAHRGVSYQPPTNEEGIYPANTMPGFETALRMGFDGFELDVRVTKDKRFLVSHDQDVSVSTTVKGYVEEKNIDEFTDVLVVKSAFIPEKKSTAKNAFIAAPIPTLKQVLDTYLADPRLKTIVVDIKPDTEENILTAAKNDFEGFDDSLHKKILFLTRSASTAKDLQELFPGSDIALEGSIGTEPLDPDEWEKYYPQAIGEPNGGHNTISFGANLIMAFDSEETILEKLDSLSRLNDSYDYKSCLWTVTKDWRLNFLRENEIFPEYILTDAPYYKIGLQQLRYSEGMDIKFPTTRELLVKDDIYPTYKKLLNDNVLDFWYQSRMMFELSYGIGSPNQKEISNDFAPVGNLEIKIARSEIDKYSKKNVELNERYLFFSYMNSDFYMGDVSAEEIVTTSYRFGIGSNDGLGYYGGNGFSVTQYVGQGFVWTQLNDFSDFLKPQEGDTASADYNILNRYWGTYRFGDRSLYGIKAEISSIVQLDLYYETAVVYPRHLFWYWSGSFILAEGGLAVLSHFLDDYTAKQEALGPVINFLIKSLYLYGYYVLREQDMNWPFSTEAPLRYEMINIGVSIVL
jgi:glycerophosphoryl diester phosphodiesterase